MYGIVFNKIDIIKDQIEELLAFCIGETEEQALEVFRKIENHYTEHKGQPEVVIDLVDKNRTILHDYSLTYSHAKELAFSMGWDIEKNELINQ
ncbi:hypothetical protein MHH70_01785 [Metasolibacillus sp. FSL H7-0170]|uniref:hypothetical protein n=1 Tax=Metasolibacillus TaxID=2703677 RepID=UPI000D37F1C4|nr:hypothetical protein [Metasolibacillus fluoroglycofenilyticus]